MPEIEVGKTGRFQVAPYGFIQDFEKHFGCRL